MILKRRTIVGHRRKKKRRLSEKRFIEENPTSLIDLPETRDLFTKEELEKLIPIAEQMWIDWRGKLPKGYVSPLEKENNMTKFDIETAIRSGDYEGVRKHFFEVISTKNAQMID